MDLDPRSTRPAETDVTRRQFGRQLAWAALAVSAGASGWIQPARASDHDARKSPAQTPPLPSPIRRELLDDSPFVYISPLHADGRESTCHAELWYAWLDESVVVTVASDRWKASALKAGLGHARIWVGDHGRWKTWYGGRNEAFRAAPHFDARVEKVSEPGLVDRLLAVYETKYPDEVADWRDLMRQGSADGSRVILRYTPI